MEKIEKINFYLELYDLYKNLLTNRQREIFELYYFDDLSLFEISEKINITRVAVHNSIKSTEDNLVIFEEKLNILEKNKKINNLLENFNNLNPNEFLEKLKKINESN